MGADSPMAFLSGVLAGLAVAMPFGPIGTYLVALAARQPRRTATSAALGVATTDGVYALAAGLGGVVLAGMIRTAAPVLRVGAALALAGLAVRTVWVAVRAVRRSPGGPIRTSGLTAGRAYISLLALTAVNPLTVLTFSAVVLGGSAAHAPFVGQATGSSTALFAVGAFAASAVWHLLLALGGSLLGRLITGRRGRLAVTVASGLLMLALAVAVVLT